MKHASDLQRVERIAKRLERKFRKAEGAGSSLADSVKPAIFLDNQEEDKMAHKMKFRDTNNSPVTWVEVGSSIIAYQPNGAGFLVISPSKGSAYVAWRRIFRKYPEISFAKKNIIVTNNPICEDDVKRAFGIQVERN